MTLLPLGPLRSSMAYTAEHCLAQRLNAYLRSFRGRGVGEPESLSGGQREFGGAQQLHDRVAHLLET
ncbi:MAG: hypothetical protein ACRDT0_02960 [Pseudonocardiaceae bacterium]